MKKTVKIQCNWNIACVQSENIIIFFEMVNAERKEKKKECVCEVYTANDIDDRQSRIL